MNVPSDSEFPVLKLLQLPLRNGNREIALGSPVWQERIIQDHIGYLKIKLGKTF